ncbi:MAG: septum formation family protein [Nocardioidaceae bacterium]
MHRILVLASLLTALLVVGACTTGTTPSGSPSPSSAPSGPASSAVSASPSPSATSSAPAVPPAPKLLACYRLGLKQLTSPTNNSNPVGCSHRHDALTIFVGRLHTVVNGHSVAVDSATVQRQLARTCPRKLAGYVGGSLADRQLSRLKVVWFSPSLAQADNGADWFRCDLVGFAAQDTLLGLPPAPQIHGALDRSDGLDRFGLCGTAAPGANNFARVICSHQHSWKAIATIHIAGGPKYPGVGTVRGAGDSACKARVKAISGYTLKLSYGWEWPSAAQWKAGQHYGYCWAPG